MHLRLLGAVSLRDDTGKDLLEEFSQPKRSALLAYLMVASPGDYVRRDILLALFWPDATEADGRRALNQAIHYIRRMVGADALLSRGAESISVDLTRLGCDVLDFDAAVRDGRHERALELYRGHLMEGFFLSGLPEFEQWLAGERAKRARAAAAAAWTLSDGATDVRHALALGQRAYHLQPDESGLRRLMLLHDQAGDRAAALRLYDEFAQRLRDEYGAPPSPETEMVIAEIRARLAPSARGSSRPFASRAPRRLPALAAGAVLTVLAVGAALAAVRRGDAAGDLTMASTGAHSRAALQAYAEGDAEERAGRYATAEQAFRRAVEQDTNFALAYYRLSTAANWTGDGNMSEWGQLEAYAKRASLGSRARADVEGWYYFQHVMVDSADAAYARALAEDPNDAEAVFHRADLYFHWGPSFGRSLASTAPEWARVIALEPNNAGALLHAARVAAASRDRSSFDSIAARVGRLGPDADRAIELQVLRAFVFGDRGARVAATRSLMLLKDPIARDVFDVTAAVTPGQVDVDDVLMRAMFRNAFESREDGQMLVRAQIQFARGHLGAMAATMDSTARLNAGHTREFRALLATVPFPAASPQARRAAAERLSAGPAPTYRRGAVMRDYLLGMLAVRGGDLAAAERLAQALDTVSGTSNVDSAYAIRTGRIIRAEVRKARGQYASALDMLGPPAVPPDLLLPNVWTYPVAHERFLRAELLEATGKSDEALRWYATFPDPRAYDFMFLPAALLRSAELSDRLGRRAEAAARYRDLLALWNSADPALNAEVDVARRQLGAR